RTKTLTSGGSSILPPYLAQTLAGGSGYSGEAVRACARAAWGNPGYSAVPVTFSYCEWQKATGYTTTPAPGNPGVYAPNPVGPAPGYGGASQPAWPAAAQSPPVPGNEIIIDLQNPGPHPAYECPTWNGHDTAGGFGYLTANSCHAVVTTGGWVQVDTGNNSPCDMSQFFNKIIYLPVFDCVLQSGSVPSGAPTAAMDCASGAGSNTWYHIQGFAKFFLSGYKTSGSDQMARTATGTVPCSGSDRCLSGWFLQGLVDASQISPPTPPGSPSFGAYAVQVAG
ncbi:MAG TPA: hypothetical protein VFK66_04500, partial [Oryzihumus sp.]|nr:hypothetical protein [Oryzihumus sp.]